MEDRQVDNLAVLVILSAPIWLQDMVAVKAVQTQYRLVLCTAVAGMVMAAAAVAVVQL